MLRPLHASFIRLICWFANLFFETLQTLILRSDWLSKWISIMSSDWLSQHWLNSASYPLGKLTEHSFLSKQFEMGKFTLIEPFKMLKAVQTKQIPNMKRIFWSCCFYIKSDNRREWCKDRKLKFYIIIFVSFCFFKICQTSSENIQT